MTDEHEYRMPLKCLICGGQWCGPDECEHDEVDIVGMLLERIEQMRPFLRHGFDCVYERDRRDITCPEVRACDCGLAALAREIAGGEAK